MKINLKTLLTADTLISLPAFLFWSAAILSFFYKQNNISDFYSTIPTAVKALMLIILPAVVLLSITIAKHVFEQQQNNLYKLGYTVLRRFSYFTIISSILLFTLSQVLSRS
jgi:hypothetical protein